MSVVVLDSSAYLARLWGEDGSQVVEAFGGNYLIGSVNAAEIFTKILERGPIDVARAKIRILATSMNIVPFDDRQSMTCAELRISTRHLGLSLGDRACLALAIREKATVVTADRSWAGLDLGIGIKIIR